VGSGLAEWTAVVRSLTLIALVAMTAPARADRVPDASLRAVVDRGVRLELDNAPAVEGRLLAFEDATVTLARTGTNEVITVERARVVRVIASDAAAPVVVADAPERMRVLGVHSSLLGTVAVDADYKRLHGFASTSLILPILTAAGSDTWFAGALGGGFAFPLGRRWKVDVFADIVPFRATSFYTYVGFGLGAGIHYTSASGFAIGATFPVLGFATRIGSSPYGYDPSFRYNDSLGYYYLAGLAGLPLLTLGYRFATNCPRID
jgi:hypothetical protein